MFDIITFLSEVKCQLLPSDELKRFSRVRALPPLVSRRQVVTLLHLDVEGAGFVVVADAQEDLPAHLGVAIVTSLTVHAHHAVDAALCGRDVRMKM